MHVIETKFLLLTRSTLLFQEAKQGIYLKVISRNGIIITETLCKIQRFSMIFQDNNFQDNTKLYQTDDNITQRASYGFLTHRTMFFKENL